MTRRRLAERVLALQYFVASSSFLGTSTSTSGKNCLLDLLRIKKLESVQDKSLQALALSVIFESCALL